jgi:hypothetical protein
MARATARPTPTPAPTVTPTSAATPTLTPTPIPLPTDTTIPLPTATPTPHPVRGRRPEQEQAAIRERVEALMYQNLRSPAIHRALTGPESPNPVAVSERQVRAHMAAVKRGWTERASREHLLEEQAKAIAIAEETARTATVRSTLNARSNLGAAYLNTALKAQELVARLRGLYAPSRTELSGPDGTSLGVSVELADHPAEHLDPREEARRLRRWAGRLETIDVDPPTDPTDAPGRQKGETL